MRGLLSFGYILFLVSLSNLAFAGDSIEEINGDSCNGHITAELEIEKLVITAERTQNDIGDREQTTLGHTGNEEQKATDYIVTANRYREQKNYYEAIEAYDLALVSAPFHAEALYWSIKLRLLKDDGSMKDKTIIADHLHVALNRHPADKRFRILNAEFAMLKRGPCTVPGVSYLAEFLSDEEFIALQDIFSRASWSRVKKHSSSAINFANGDKQNFEKLLGPITERLTALNIFPTGVKEVGWAVVRYPQGGSLKQHKDDKTRVDHFVLGISIGGPCDLDFVLDRGSERTSLPLASKSVFITENEAHDKCTHGISNVKDERFSLLFYIPTPGDGRERFDLETKTFVRPENKSDHFCDCEFHRLMRIIQFMNMMQKMSEK